MSTGIDILLRRATAAPYTAEAGAPASGVAILACMDARLRVESLLGLEPNEAHVIRNAGGLATTDALRSLLVSQRFKGTREVMVIQHTDCGMCGLDEEAAQEQLTAETGAPFPEPLGGFTDLEASVRGAVATIRSSPFLPHRDAVRGFVYDVTAGTLREVAPG